jgi:ABC-type sugar transport system substrate-binding protein
MRSRSSTRVALTAIVALAVVLATAATATAKLTAAGPVVASSDYQSIKGPWLVWDKASCGFKATSTHPATYRAVLRKDDSGLNVVYTPEATTFPVDPIINGSFKGWSAKSGIKLKQLSNDYPSTSRPIDVANQAVQIKTDVVVSANVLTNLYPQIQAIYKKGCIPMVNMFNLPGTTDPAPGFQSGYTAGGIGMGAAAVDLVKQKGWPASSIWLVQCGNDVIGKGRNTLNDVNRAFRETLVKAFKIPKSRITEISCASEQEARSKTIDWVTAHPQAKNVIAEMWADSLGVAMAQALESKGFTRKNAIAAGGDASDSVLDLMAKKKTVLQVDMTKDFPNWGVYGLAMAQDVAAGRPVPSFSEVKLTFITDKNVKDVIKRQKTAVRG